MDNDDDISYITDMYFLTPPLPPKFLVPNPYPSPRVESTPDTPPTHSQPLDSFHNLPLYQGYVDAGYSTLKDMTPLQRKPTLRTKMRHMSGEVEALKKKWEEVAFFERLIGKEGVRLDDQRCALRVNAFGGALSDKTNQGKRESFNLKGEKIKSEKDNMNMWSGKSERKTKSLKAPKESWPNSNSHTSGSSFTIFDENGNIIEVISKEMAGKTSTESGKSKWDFFKARIGRW